MTKQEFEKIIKPLDLLDVENRNFLTKALLGNFNNWHKAKNEEKPIICDGWIHDERVKHNDDKFCPLCGEKLQ